MLISKLLTLADLMERYQLGDLVLMLTGIRAAQRDSGRPGNQTKVCTDEYYSKLAMTLEGLATMCANFDPDPSLIEQIKALQKQLEDGSADRRGLALNVRLICILDGIQNNLESRTFMFVPQDQAHGLAVRIWRMRASLSRIDRMALVTSLALMAVPGQIPSMAG